MMVKPEFSYCENTASKPAVIILNYYSETFHDLTWKNTKEIRDALIERPLRLRKQSFLPNLPALGWLPDEEAWTMCQTYLETIEIRMKEQLESHSSFFWLHLYRRIGLLLYPGHDDKVDANTLALVRQIAELAILKHGNLSVTDDVAVSTDCKFSDILGGHYRRIILKISKSKYDAMQRFLSLKASPQWVVTKFRSTDLVNVYAIEGLSYEYWRITALMRALGKGAVIRRSEDDWIEYRPNSELAYLIRSYDDRVGGHSGATLAGTWSGTRELKRNDIGTLVLIPYYNVDRLGAEDGISIPGVRLPSKEQFIPNFLLHFFDVVPFLDTNRVLSEPFYNSRGYSIEAFLAVVWAIANAVLIPARVLFAGIPDVSISTGPFAGEMVELMQRGYKAFPNRNKLALEVLNRLQIFDSPFRAINPEEISKCVGDLSLDTETQSKISLWSGGPRYPIIRFGDGCTILDLVSIPSLLRSSFDRIFHDGNRRGNEFEAEFRIALANAGFPVEHCGIMEAMDGTKREMDASVRIADTLYIFECISKSRRLDFEIGRASTITDRNENLKKKLEQVYSLKAFIAACSRGRNYDLSWTKNIECFVVSPFIEWVWSCEARLWKGSKPRVISADEAIDFLRAESSEQIAAESFLAEQLRCFPYTTQRDRSL